MFRDKVFSQRLGSTGDVTFGQPEKAERRPALMRASNESPGGTVRRDDAQYGRRKVKDEDASPWLLPYFADAQILYRVGTPERDLVL